MISTIPPLQEAIHSSSPPFLNALSFDTTTLTAQSLYTSYKSLLLTDPLPTKMLTGAVVAVAGDAIAQGCVIVSDDDTCQIYDAKRATSFALFDAAYRAAQQFLYGPMIAYFQGQLVLSLLWPSAASANVQHLAAALEQALVSQLVIIPVVYYPVFFAVTGAVQGLTAAETLERARETFGPIMKRNLLFWIPVQFAVFGYCSESLQIPVLTVCGLIWTIILSFVAGSVKQQQQQPVVVEDEELQVFMATSNNGVVEFALEEDDVYCVTGFEPNCHIDPDNLFRPPSHQTTIESEERLHSEETITSKEDTTVNGEAARTAPSTEIAWK